MTLNVIFSVPFLVNTLHYINVGNWPFDIILMYFYSHKPFGFPNFYYQFHFIGWTHVLMCIISSQ